MLENVKRVISGAPRGPLALSLVLGLMAGATAAQETKSYTNVTQDVLDGCLKSVARNRTSEGWAEYQAGNSGLVWIKAEKFMLGTITPVELTFDYDPAKAQISYTIKEITDYVLGKASEGQIWEGFDKTMVMCKGNSN